MKMQSQFDKAMASKKACCPTRCPRTSKWRSKSRSQGNRRATRSINDPFLGRKWAAKLRKGKQWCFNTMRLQIWEGFPMPKHPLTFLWKKLISQAADEPCRQCSRSMIEVSNRWLYWYGIASFALQSDHFSMLVSLFLLLMAPTCTHYSCRYSRDKLW